MKKRDANDNGEYMHAMENAIVKKVNGKMWVQRVIANIALCAVATTAQAEMSDAILRGALQGLYNAPSHIREVQSMSTDEVQINPSLVNDTVRSAVSKAGMPFKECQADSLHSFTITAKLSDGESYSLEIKARRSISPQIVVECETGYRSWLKAKCETLSEVKTRERIWTSILEKAKQDVPLVGLEVCGGFIEKSITEDERIRMKLSPRTNWTCWGYAQIGFKGELDYVQVETNPNLLTERIMAIPKAHEKMVSAINRHVAEYRESGNP